ncbi:MAG TPA: hypothetical protein VEB68_11595 [Croceibacterium sp.]|nr:hypothetical protein [Croceibacterium sp.]
MNEPKSFASLGPTLLARKGGAKPAMRPQLPMAGMSGPQAAQAIAHDLEDLGWNDMGEQDLPADHTAEVLQLTPAPANPEAEARTDEGSPPPVVRSMHEELAERLGENAPEYLVERATSPVKQSAPPVARPAAAPAAKPATAKPVAVNAGSARAALEQASRRAAFTLRLDAKRHLKLRLASTVKNRSAQQLVTMALDKFLSEIPEIEALAAQVKRD